LATVIEAWATLPDAIKAGILAMIRAMVAMADRPIALSLAESENPAGLRARGGAAIQ
jgi:hypothetical protein